MAKEMDAAEELIIKLVDSKEWSETKRIVQTAIEEYQREAFEAGIIADGKVTKLLQAVFLEPNTHDE